MSWKELSKTKECTMAAKRRITAFHRRPCQYFCVSASWNKELFLSQTLVRVVRFLANQMAWSSNVLSHKSSLGSGLFMYHAPIQRSIDGDEIYVKKINFLPLFSNTMAFWRVTWVSLCCERVYHKLSTLNFSPNIPYFLHKKIWGDSPEHDHCSSAHYNCHWPIVLE